MQAVLSRLHVVLIGAPVSILCLRCLNMFVVPTVVVYSVAFQFSV